jgi:hypothetical protein
MKPIEQNEMYEHLSQFLRNKGIDMKEGAYTRRIQKGCSLLTDAVNLTQQGMTRAKTEIDKRLEQMRQVIHEKTAPKSPPRAPTNAPPPTQGKPGRTPAAAANAPAGTKRSARRRKTGTRGGRKK